MTTILYAEDGSEEYAREGQSCSLHGELVDADGDPVLLASVGYFKLTLFDRSTSAIINSRSAQDVKNVNGGTLNSDGTFVIKLGVSDNVIVTTTRRHKTRETHVARLTWSWSDGSDTLYGGEELDFDVEVWASPT